MRLKRGNEIFNTFSKIACMTKKLLPILLLLVLPTFYVACHTSYKAQSLQYKNYAISDSLQTDARLAALIKPYGDSVRKSMSEVVGYADKSLDKLPMESELGNYMADALWYMAKEKYQVPVDAAMVNYGGIRLNQLPAGAVTRGKIFELMPFDNVLILQKLKGSVLQQLLDLTASKGGWPLAGITMQIRAGKAVNVRIGGKPLDPDAVYTVANADFVANGGDDAEMLRRVPQISNGYLVRDAFFDYIRLMKAQGKNMTANLENRVTNAE